MLTVRGSFAALGIVAVVGTDDVVVRGHSGVAGSLAGVVGRSTRVYSSTRMQTNEEKARGRHHTISHYIGGGRIEQLCAYGPEQKQPRTVLLGKGRQLAQPSDPAGAASLG